MRLAALQQLKAALSAEDNLTVDKASYENLGVSKVLVWGNQQSKTKHLNGEAQVAI